MSVREIAMKAVIHIDTASREDLASNCTSWRSKLKHHLTSRKKSFSVQLLKRGSSRKTQASTNRLESTVTNVTFETNTATVTNVTFETNTATHVVTCGLLNGIRQRT